MKSKFIRRSGDIHNQWIPGNSPDLRPKLDGADSIILSVRAKIEISGESWHPSNRSATIKKIADLQSKVGNLLGINVEAAESVLGSLRANKCPVCGWIHDSTFSQIKPDDGEPILLRGILPEIVGLVHGAHERGLRGLSSKHNDLINLCAGYRHPCKAFDDLNHRLDYKRLFDTSRRGFISLRGALGIGRNKSEATPE